jgi:peptidyl-prolyl cis-trans isomerase SurA
VRTVLVLIPLVLATTVSTGETIDGIAATVDDVVVTMSDLDRMEVVFLVAGKQDEERAAYRKRLLEHLIDRILQRRDIRRFSTIEVDPEAVERRLERLVELHGSQEKFEEALDSVGITRDEVKDFVAGEIEVRTYIDERFAPLVFVPIEEVERFYQNEWTESRRKSGLEVQPFEDVRETLRDLLRSERLEVEVDKWTRQLRARANVDVFVYR